MAPRQNKSKKAGLPKVMYGRVTKAKDILTETPVINPIAVKEMSLNVLECPVCMEPLVKGNICSTPCGHIFCSGCIHRAAAVATSSDRRRCPRFLCPTCRRSLTLKLIRPLYL